MPRLSAADLGTALERLPGWTAANNEIGKTFVFGNFVEAIAFVNRVADLAEAAGHHPDLDIRYNRVRIALTTHDEGGVSERDTALAGEIEGAGEDD
jgi:4a-hydroxytetrahydrobiopterin dehydratase